MRPTRVLFAAALLAGLAVPVAGVSAAPATPDTPGQPAPLPAHSERPVCAPPAAHTAACHAHVVTRTDGATPLATSVYTSGFRPADLQKVYGLTSTSTATVAIVDAFDNPNVEADLNVYRNRFGPSPCTSNTPNPCFTKVNQSGGTI